MTCSDTEGTTKGLSRVDLARLEIRQCVPMSLLLPTQADLAGGSTFLGCLDFPEMSVYSHVPAMAMPVPTRAWVVRTCS